MSKSVTIVKIDIDNNEPIKTFESMMSAYKDSNETSYVRFAEEVRLFNYYNDIKYRYYIIDYYNKKFNKKIQHIDFTSGVVLLDNYGKFIKEYLNINDVEKDGFKVANVKLVCEGKHKQTYDCIFKWRHIYFEEKGIKDISELKNEDISKKSAIIIRCNKDTPYIAKKVVQIDSDNKVIYVYDKMRYVCYHGYNTSEVSDCCRGARKSVGNRKFMYLKDYMKVMGFTNEEQLKTNCSLIFDPLNPMDSDNTIEMLSRPYRIRYKRVKRS